MTSRFPLAVAAASLAFAFAPAAWAAGAISAIAPGANNVALVNGQATVRFMVSGQNDGMDCGIIVNYGDEDSPDTRIIGTREGPFPREFTHTFKRAGQFTVSAKGDRVKQTGGCAGAAATSVSVIEPGGGRRRGRPECPAGWSLREGSFDRRTGAFACAPAWPSEKMDCGPGLRYYERDNLVGCAPVGRR